MDIGDRFQIWATLDRISEMHEKSAQEMRELREKDKLEEERRREKEEQRREKDKLEARREKKEFDKRMKKLEGLFTTQWGALMESLVEGDLVPLLKKRNISVTHTQTRMYGRHGDEHYEIDILADNGEEVVLVEVKTTLRPGDVPHFLEKLGKFTTYRPLYKEKTIYGAVAFLKADTSVQVYAERQGLFVIRATGSSASIVNDTKFEPRVF